MIAKRHTRYGKDRYLEGLSKAVASLGQYQATAAQWIEGFRGRKLSRQEADSYILRAFEENLVGARMLPLLLQEWRSPNHDEFKDSSAWALWNCFTSVLRTKQESHPAAAALTTIKLQRLLSPEVIDGSATTAA